ncbi:xanthine dehydrogenase, molybdenum binding subunit [Candidatus Velamenicoccus archaeovorus]|uniref:Xanthine dehydrogenase, molybdenum binding subunit n=1 Tax=Velamenicoccus archaeovorus TaxID=1930593 RepID=A0A410P339_VELA1|nr:molybdopterin cofactor-binding domain-containing protein [Candidatus Velamenicoccus archaeovorus]QAT16498.1 xanthine dehydrogenase, molybdenum binding subunit [Candidatus Velamenicoccus archaeovorus]
MKTTSPVGKSVPRIDARQKVTGEATYVFDLKFPGMLVGKMLRSPHAHARIVKIDTSKAEKLPGVRAVVTAEDTPKIKFGSNEYFFPYTVDQYPLEFEKVRYIGDEIAAVAAVDEATAEQALSLIDVQYEVLPAVFDAVAAMKPGAPQIHAARNNIGVMLPVCFGDPDRALRESDYVHEDVFVLPSAAHAALEPHVCIGQYEVSTDRITLWSSTQAPFKIREAMAKTLKMQEADIRVIKLNVGGGFGGKLEMFPMDFCACLLSKKCGGAPVKMMCTRQEVFSCTRRKHPMIYKLKSGVKKDGTLMAITGEVIADGGAYCSYGPTVIAAGIMRFMMVYQLKNIRLFGSRVYTNNSISGAIRGFGGVQSGFAIESHMDMLARGIGMDPVEFRLKNTTDPNTLTINKMIISSNGLKDCIRKAAEISGWREKYGAKKETSPGVLRGIGIGIAADVMGSKMYKSHESAGSIIKVEEDGSVYLFTGAADTGQGSDTAMAQIAAHELGVAYERIRIKAADTEITPFDTGSFASRVTFISGNATKNAATDAKRQILEVVAQELKLGVQDLDIEDEQVVNKKSGKMLLSFDQAVVLCYSFNYGRLIIGRGSYNPKTTPIDFRTGEGNISGSYGFEAQIAEVEVDTKTGRVKVLKMYDVHDIGYPINPASVHGQIEGSIVMGLGYTLYEDLKFKEGRVVNPSFSKYRIPRSTEMIPIESVFIETNDPQGPFGAKGMGEASLLPTAAAIANAIYDAVGVQIKDLPITPQKVLAALKDIKNKKQE